MGYRLLALWVASVAQLLVVVDISVMNVALPSIQDDLGTSATLTTWVALAYNLGFAGALLAGARLADVIGTGRVLRWGLTLFVLASAVGGIATDGAVLVGARGLQGLCAAVVSPATFTLITTTHPEGLVRARAIAIWTSVGLAGGGVGNILGGALTELVSWRAVLLVNLPIGGVVLAGALVLGRRAASTPGRGRIDPLGAILATGGFACASYALSVADGHAGALTAGTAVVASVMFFLALVRQQRRSSDPLVPPGLSRNRLVVRGNLAMALTATCFQVGIWYFLTYRMQGPLGLTPIQAGLGFLPLTVAMLVVNTWITPRLMTFLSSRVLLVAGSVTAASGLLWLGLAPGESFPAAVLGPSLVLGLGGGLLNTPLATIVTSGVPSEQAGAASGLMNTGKQFGGAVGLAAATGVSAAVGTDQAAFLLLAALVAGVAVTALRLRTSPSRPGVRRARSARTTGPRR